MDPNHDQIYLRFLFRLGDNREEGRSLYESFEVLLEELGFQIEFVPEEDGNQGITKAFDTERDGEAIHAQARGTQMQARRSRRSSFGSVYDAGDGSTREIRLRPRSRASLSRLDISQRSILDTRPSTRATTRRTEKMSTHASPLKPSAVQNRGNRLTAEEFAKSLQHLQQQQNAGSSQTRPSERQPAALERPVLRFPRSASLSSNDTLQTRQDSVESNNEMSAVLRPHQLRYTVSSHERLHNPSRTQLFRDAETFHHYRLCSVARDVVDKWCYAALQARDRYEYLDRLAAAHDTEILLRQAFEHWRLRLHAKKHAAAIERYFKHEEQRIARARDLMLLSKAFTHWAQSASDERLRTTDAQKKILSMKYFGAWRDITVGNQLTVRHHPLRKFFGIWKKRYVQCLTDGIRAELLFQKSIHKNAYWHWFWTFCERRAPEWRAGRLRRKYLSQWITAFKGNYRRCQHIQTRFEATIQWRTFSDWANKARVALSCRHEAIAFNQRRECARALHTWRRNRVHAPLYQQVSNMVDWRVAGMTFGLFVARFRFERQANAVNRLRMMRNAWTYWNDRLRWQTVAHRIDDRYCLEALYKWVVSERCILLQRLTDERLKQRFLYRSKDASTARQLRRTRSLRLFEDAQRKRLSQHYISHWHSRLDFCLRHERIAFEFHAPKVAQDALRPWIQSSNHLKRLNGVAKDTNFYYTTRDFLKRWRAALVELKKQKRKNAYKQVRRKQKMKLARGALEQWLSLSVHLHDNLQQADLANQTHLLKFGTVLFDHWKDRFHETMNQKYRASQHYERRLLKRHLYTWTEELQNQSRREELAEINYDMRVKNLAFSWFNKLRLKIIELKGQEANADNLRSWYEKRHFRSILRQWHDTAAKRAIPQEEAVFSSRVIRTRPPAVVDDGPISRAEDWTDFDMGDWIPALEAQSSTTPLPGYLSTPSKRAARAKTLVKFSTTPAGTPFEQRLRSQISSTPRTARRAGFGRSTTALRGTTFGAILEDSPRTPDARREG